MARVCLQLPWNPDAIEEFVALARSADAAGVHSLWINEGFGHDAFSGLTILARETERTMLGTSIVNVYSRTPGTLAQHFATIDQLSGGRVIIGLGASAPGVIRRFHGLPFEAPLARLRETTELLRAHWQRERFSHNGRWSKIDRALQMGATPAQETPPIFLATMAPASVRATAEIADGWLPTWIPTGRLETEIRALRSASEAAGRPAHAVTVRSPATTVVAHDAATADETRRQQIGALAFFVARNGDFYFNQFCRQGLEEEAVAIRASWSDHGREAAIATVSQEMANAFGFVGSVEECRSRFAADSAKGVDLHSVSLVGFPASQRETVLKALVSG